MAGKLTTHALDTEAGRGAGGLRVALFSVGQAVIPLGEIVLDARGRGLLSEALEAGVYELVFHAAAYHRAQGAALSEPPFLDRIAIRIGVAEADADYHVPLLLTRYSYSTYRGG